MPCTDAPKRYAFEQFTAIRRYRCVLAFSFDGSSMAYSTNTSGQFNVWRQPSEGGYPRQLTLYTEKAVRDISWSPDGETILFTADEHGDEFYQLYTVPQGGGQPEEFVSEPGVQHHRAASAWSPDGRRRSTSSARPTSLPSPRRCRRRGATSWPTGSATPKRKPTS